MADDRRVWECICQGDAQAFDTFYRDNAPRLQEFLRQFVGNRQVAEDLMQETFTQIWRRPNGFRPERGTLRAYLYGIGRKRAAEWWRTHGATHGSDENERAACSTETVSAVKEALEQLPEGQRTLLWLREVEGQSYAELAEIFEIPIGTVRSRLFVAREALRTIWQGPRDASKENS
ncbi:MAG TPA: sigma-70 family RNA polymerase sigma factor [Candidatus Acidoferrales bacterium]|nr:sigma-70 family RNA polymerase sigma factor [Candidatus Acidoferrales bacterium]